MELAINLLVGYPCESLESIKNVINFFKTHRPTTISIDSYFWAYKNTELANLIKTDVSLRRDLINLHSESSNFLEPVFYNQLSHNLLEELISDDELFKIAWLTPEVNSQQIK